jgi:hypothetical protein
MLQDNVDELKFEELVPRTSTKKVAAKAFVSDIY